MLFCSDGTCGVFVVRGAPAPKPRGVPWAPPDLEPDRCQRETCRKLAMDHSTLRPGYGLEPLAVEQVLRDALNRGRK